MNEKDFSKPLSLRAVQVTDEFWKGEMELIRKEVIPYQWEALNDRIPDAAPSFCMHNFKTAAKRNQEKQRQGTQFQEPVYTFRGFEALPEDPAHLEDKFYGFVFQDSDFYKWIEAVGYSLAQHPDKELERVADEAIDIVCGAQQEDGYLDTYYILNGRNRIFTNLRDHHELYCLGHLLEGAVAYYHATGKRKLLDAARRFADYTAEHFGPEEGKCKGYPGHEIAEMALIRLYETTGEEKYLALSRFFIDERGTRPYYFDGEHPEQIHNRPEELRYEYHQAHLPVREQEEAVGHAVRAVYLYSGMADAARLTGDEALYKACGRIWDNVVGKKLYITGGIGATHMGEAFSFHYDLPNDTAYAETCAAIGLVFWARRMLEIKPDSEYGDVMEQALYNCVLSGMALDGKSFFYVNPLESDPKACHEDARKAHVKPVRQKWFGCACCPPNLARLISSVSTYAYTEKEDTLFVHLYMGSMVTKKVKGKEIALRMESGFPWDGRVSVAVENGDGSFTLALRIPGWSQDYTVRGTEGLTQRVKDGYLYLSGDWKQGSRVELEFPMEIRFWQADTRVREDIGRIAVTRGPVTYCMEEKDNGKDLHLITVDCEAQGTIQDFEIQGNRMVSLLLKGFRQASSGDNRQCQDGLKQSAKLYQPVKKPVKEPVQLRLIPYYGWANRGENEMTVWIRQE